MTEIIQTQPVFIPGVVNTNHRARARAIPVKNSHKWTALTYSDPDYRKWTDDFKLKFRKQTVLPDGCPAFRIYLIFVVPNVVVGTQTRGTKTFQVRRRYKADIDNLIKSVIDALQGEAFKNDSAAIPLPWPERATDFNPWVHRVDIENDVGVHIFFEYEQFTAQADLALGETEEPF